MGAWGAGSFENDAALDFGAEINSLDDIQGALVAANSQGHVVIEGEIDADIASRIIVAAECVAAMRGHRSKQMPQDLAERVHKLGKPALDLFSQARDNLSAVMSHSELCELWAEEGSGDWNRAMTDLVGRLNKPQATARKPRKKKKPVFNNSPCSFCGEPMGEEEFHQFDITLASDDISSMRRGGWAHIGCLNAALHPRHMIQHWEIDEELLAHIIAKMDAERAARENGS